MPPRRLLLELPVQLVIRWPFAWPSERTGDGLITTINPGIWAYTALMQWYAREAAGTVPPDAPPSWQVAVYKRERAGRERWRWPAWLPEQDDPEGWDCEEFAIYEGVRNAARGALPFASRTRRAYHAVVGWPDGSVTDPARESVRWHRSRLPQK